MLALFIDALQKKGLSNALLRTLKVLSIRTPRFIKTIPFYLRAASATQTIRRINGLHMHLYFNDLGISRELYIYGKREHFSTELMVSRTLIKPGDVVVDIGANIGYYALLEARIVGPSGQVLAIEPVAANHAILRQNIAANRFENIRTYNLAVGDYNGIGQMLLSDHSNWSRLTQASIPDATRGHQDVEVVTLDAFLVDKPRPALVRMDVEGYELNILRGMQETMAQAGPKIFVEFHPNLLNEAEIDEFFRILALHGYIVKTCLLNPNLEQNAFVDFAYTRLGDRQDYTGAFLDLDLNGAHRWVKSRRFNRLPHFLFVKEAAADQKRPIEPISGDAVA
jgi:FkbM family methyltransferase